MTIRLMSMQSQIFDAARDAFRRRPTTKTAWDYLVTAVECGGVDIISDSTFFCAVREIVAYLGEDTTTTGCSNDLDVQQTEPKGPRVLH
jgi:hydroxyethylthiazole kinase-like sugar kinase family protein